MWRFRRCQVACLRPPYLSGFASSSGGGGGGASSASAYAPSLLARPPSSGHVATVAPSAARGTSLSWRANAAQSGRQRPSRKLLVPPLPPFVDEKFPKPEPRVAAFMLTGTIDLRALRQRLVELGCPTELWQGQVLLTGSGEGLGQQRCSAVFLPDGCVVCWHMSQETERRVLRLAASYPARKRYAGTAPGFQHSPKSRMDQLGLGKPMASEKLEVQDAPAGVVTALAPEDGLVRLTRDTYARASDQLGISLGLAVAVRLEALENKIEARLEADWDKLNRDSDSNWNLNAVSDQIFVAEKGLHKLRYELNSERGLLDASDLVWEHSFAESLYDQVVAHFDVRRRTETLNNRMSYSLDYLHTLGEHVRHQYSGRLERIIIYLIFMELCLGIVHQLPGLTALLTGASHVAPEVVDEW